MAKSASTYMGFQVPALQSDLISFDDDFAAFKTAIDNSLVGVASATTGTGNAVGGTSFADNAGKILSSSPTSPSRVGRVISLTANGDATFLFQDNPGGNTTGVDKWVIGYDDSSGGFGISESETIPATLADSDFSIATGGAVTIASTLSVTGVASFPGGTGALDAGVNDITTGGQLIVDVDGSAVGAAGSIRFGAGSDAAIYFDGIDLVIDADAGSAGGIKLDAGDDTVEIFGSGVLQATFSTAGLNLVSGDRYQIAGNLVLDAITLGALVVNSSLTNVGTLTALTMGGNIVMGDFDVTGVNSISFTDVAGLIAGIQNRNLVDKAEIETITGLWKFQPGLLTDFIGEENAAAGVTVDGLLIKDGGIPEAAVTAHQGAIDHGSIAGLADDDHTQYLLAAGTRALAGAWDMGSQALTNVNIDSGTINGVTSLVANSDIVAHATTPTATSFQASEATAAGMYLENTDVSGIVQVYLDSNRGGANQTLATIRGQWNGTRVGQIAFNSGSDTINKDDGWMAFSTAAAGTVAEVVRITADGGLFMDNQGSNPGVLANKAALFSKDVSTVAEMFVMDEGGTATQISPHNPATGEWWFHEYDSVSDTTRVFHIERMFNFLISRFPAMASEWYEEVRGELSDPTTLASHKASLERPSRELPDEPRIA